MNTIGPIGHLVSSEWLSPPCVEYKTESITNKTSQLIDWFGTGLIVNNVDSWFVNNQCNCFPWGATILHVSGEYIYVSVPLPPADTGDHKSCQNDAPKLRRPSWYAHIITAYPSLGLSTYYLCSLNSSGVTSAFRTEWHCPTPAQKTNTTANHGNATVISPAF